MVIFKAMCATGVLELGINYVLPADKIKKNKKNRTIPRYIINKLNKK